MSRLAEWWNDRSDRERKMLLALAAVAFLCGFALLFWECLGFASTALREKAAAERSLSRARAEAARLPLEEACLRDARARWEKAKVRYERSQETGAILRDVERAAVSCGVRLVSLEPGECVEKVFRGHLRAVPFKVEVEGTYPALVDLLSEWERMAPVEVRCVAVEAAKGEPDQAAGKVGARVDLVVYSLNPPHRVEKVSGESGVYDAFFPAKTPKQAVPEQVYGPGAPAGAPGAAQVPEAVYGGPQGAL